VPLALPSDVVGTFAGELLRIAPQALAVQQEARRGVVRLTGVAAAGHRFTLVLALADPAALYASYRARLWLAIASILVTTLAAFAGLFAAWRAFQRERRLAQMKSDFVANVSHELRAPVASVRLMAESLERGTIEPGARQRDYLHLIGQECRRLSSLVANVLDFSRIDRGRRQYTFAPEDLPALVAETADVMRPYAAERRVKLVCAPVPAGTTVQFPAVDRAALQQALINLVDNAIKHSPADAEVTVGIEVQPAAAPDASSTTRIHLFVEDHGPGIPAHEQDRIFEPFYRVESGLRRETPGVGIGLSIVKHVAEAHGGRAFVRSSPGQGSRFVIELPGDREQSERPKVRTSQGQSGEPLVG
jgi:signal transduction histidine kinase